MLTGISLTEAKDKDCEEGEETKEDISDSPESKDDPSVVAAKKNSEGTDEENDEEGLNMTSEV